MTEATKLYALTDDQVQALGKLLECGEFAAIKQALAAPIDFSGAVEHFHDPADGPWIASAAEGYAEEGRCEIDGNAIVSHGDPESGAYVMAWVWVDRSDVTLPEDEEETADV